MPPWVETDLAERARLDPAMAVVMSAMIEMTMMAVMAMAVRVHMMRHVGSINNVRRVDQRRGVNDVGMIYGSGKADVYIEVHVAGARLRRRSQRKSDRPRR